MTNIDMFKDAQVKLTAIFDLKELYRYLYDWLALSREYDVTEKAYKEKVTPQGKDIEIRWEAERYIDEYSKFVIKIKWFVVGMTDIEVQQAGEKIKMNKGELNLYITAVLTTDRQEKWAESAFLSFLKGFYEKYIYADTINQLKSRLWAEGWEFVNEAKSYLSLYKYM